MKAILLTHGHFDHIGAADTLAMETGATVYVNKKDTTEGVEEYKYHPLVPVRYISDGDVITVGSLRFRVLETPGHSPGSVAFRCEDALFCGDTLFRGSCGRTDLPGGDTGQLINSLRHLFTLPPEVKVYPGHGESTTIAAERRY